MNKKRVCIIAILLFCVVMISSCKNSVEFETTDEYIYNMHTFSNAIKIACTECNELGMRIADIWHDAIAQEADINTIQYTFDSESGQYRNFNDTLSCYSQSDEYTQYRKSINTDKDNLLNIYAWLNKLPDRYSNQAKYIKEIFDSYSLYENSMLNPSGSYNEYVKSINTMDNIDTLCDTLDSLIPDYEKEAYSFEEKDLYISFYYGLRYGKYTGNFTNGNVNGEGIFTSTNVDGSNWTYTGEFKDGHFFGTGKSEWSNGTCYEGEYKDDFANGQGTLTDEKGNVSKGTFKDGNYISKETSNTESPKTTATPIDTKTLAKFQGEWKGKYKRIIISGIDVNFIHYDYSKKDIVTDILTFHFETDENGKLVVCNPSSQPRYILSITKKGKLLIQDILDDSEKDVYEYVSDNTILPEIKSDPKIGMTEEEVLNSTWGYPKKKNTTQTINGTQEQWVYEEGYIYLTNGIVTSIQN